METICINGIEFNNFGPNNMSHGMSLISLYPAPENLVQRVLNGEFPGVYLNPSARCDSEFYGVFGTEEQYAKLYKDQKECQIAKQLLPHISLSAKEFKQLSEEIRANYKDWWEK